MPRPLLQKKTQTVEKNSLLSATAPLRQENRMDQTARLELERRLRKPRSEEYMKALRQLDAGGHIMDHSRAEALVNQIRKEFPEIQLDGLLIGIVAVCYLGRPYEVHSLDLAGDIIQHYKKGETMPGGLERARTLAMCGGYEFIEVYTNCLRAVSEDGSVAVIRN